MADPTIWLEQHVCVLMVDGLWICCCEGYLVIIDFTYHPQIKTILKETLLFVIERQASQSIEELIDRNNIMREYRHHIYAVPCQIENQVSSSIVRCGERRGEKKEQSKNVNGLA